MNVEQEKKMIKRQATRVMPGNRRYERVAVHGYSGDVADGSQVMGGVVEDVSSAGLKIAKLPDSFSAARQQYVAVVSGDDRHFKILIQPRWFKKEEGSNFMDVGFKIIDAPWEWMEFISMKVPKSTN